MSVKAQSNVADSARTDVGEIDTRAPFESVKAAVSLFGEGAFSPYKPIVKKSKPHSSEVSQRALANETQLHVAQKDLNKLKEQLKNCETTRVQALTELDKAKRTVEDLTQKLKIISESREHAVSETAKLQSKHLEEVSASGAAENGVGSWKHDLDNAREKYTVAIAELDTAKQELRRIKQGFDLSMDAKTNAFKQEVDAKKTIDTNTERATELSKEIADMQESLVHVNSASLQAKADELKITVEKDTKRQQYKLALEETQQKLMLLKKESDPETAASLEAKLVETTSEIDSTRKEIDKVRNAELESVKTVRTELGGAKEVLQKVAEEESSLRSLLESIKLELESVKKEHMGLKEKEAETESIVANLNVNLQKSKADLEKAIAGESKAREACDDLMSTLKQLSLESENARRDAETMKKNASELKKESEATKVSLEEAEKQLEVALKNAEAAKAAEADALQQIKILSEKANVARTSTSESGAMITISPEEFDSLSRKVEESEKLAEMKVAAAMAQVEAVKASENEARNKFDASSKELEEIKSATSEAIKKAEMAEAARQAVEGEMKRWREKEQKKAAETASRILSDSVMSKQKDASPLPARAPVPSPPRKHEESHKSTEKTPAIRKALMPHLISGFFHRKKSHSGSASYLPGEKPV